MNDVEVVSTESFDKTIMGEASDHVPFKLWDELPRFLLPSGDVCLADLQTSRVVVVSLE